MSQDWKTRAACHGQWDLFHGPPAENRANIHSRTQAAKAICAVCPVRRPCLQLALDTHDRWGIYAGTTDKDRRHLKRDAA
ncbi:WhiB family transcriptional regulator [Actinophytocola sediminis]